MNKKIKVKDLKKLDQQVRRRIKSIMNMEVEGGSKVEITGARTTDRLFYDNRAVNDAVMGYLEGEPLNLSSLFTEEDEGQVDVVITYDFKNNFSYEFAIGDKVVFPTTAMGDDLMAVGEIIEENDDEYKIILTDPRTGTMLCGGNKDSRYTNWRFVLKEKCIPANCVNSVDSPFDLKEDNWVVTNIDNRTVITKVKSIRKTVRTYAGNKLSYRNFYLLSKKLN